ncbi:hypothetical protein [Chitinophaga sp. LS1]|uniref:hypothetical protein n=1 Tax=Chitinophaga sp. LS1 TaxID=3051176 RepID=UPI002AAB9FA8|nr:hypothetical protein [Chitinophaga sp. LS1]WPV63890.1 hypothetical protein QQL36_19000 [Chitinophaga sp. LS1]
MSDLIFESNRYFTLFDVVVSHGQLLLRAQKNETYSHNIDIVFWDTSYIQLYTRLYGISIRKVEKNGVISYNSVTEYLNYDKSYLFEVSSGEEVYYVAASYLKVFENQLAFNETSLGVLEYRGRDNEIATSIKG